MFPDIEEESKEIEKLEEKEKFKKAIDEKIKLMNTKEKHKFKIKKKESSNEKK